MSFEFCAQHYQHGWPQISSTTCNANIIMLFASAGILSMKVFITILNGIFKKKMPFGFAETYYRSIFSSLSPNTWAQRAFWWLLYFITSYGILFIRPLGYILSTIIMQNILLNPLAIFVTTITETIFFFDVFFVIFFFGMKIEMLHVGGNPAVSLEERKWFLKTVIKRSSAFALLCFCSGMLRMATNRDSFTMFDQFDTPLLDWVLGMIQYFLIFSLAFARRSYVNYSEIMQDQKIKQKKQKEWNLTLTQHVNTQVLPSEGVADFLRNLDASDEQNFIAGFTTEITKQVHISSHIFENKANLNSNSSNCRTLVENTREKYIVGTISLVCIMIDAFLNGLADFAGMVFKMINDDQTSSVNPIYIITFTLMIMYFWLRNW